MRASCPLSTGSSAAFAQPRTLAFHPTSGNLWVGNNDTDSLTIVRGVFNGSSVSGDSTPSTSGLAHRFDRAHYHYMVWETRCNRPSRSLFLFRSDPMIESASDCRRGTCHPNTNIRYRTLFSSVFALNVIRPSSHHVFAPLRRGQDGGARVRRRVVAGDVSGE